MLSAFLKSSHICPPDGSPRSPAVTDCTTKQLQLQVIINNIIPNINVSLCHIDYIRPDLQDIRSFVALQLLQLSASRTEILFPMYVENVVKWNWKTCEQVLADLVTY